MLEPALPLALLWQYTPEADTICPARLAAAAQKIVYEPSPLTTSEASDAFAIGRSKTADGGIIFSSDSHRPWEAVGTLSLAHEGGLAEFSGVRRDRRRDVFLRPQQRLRLGMDRGTSLHRGLLSNPNRKGSPPRLPVRWKASGMVAAPYRIKVRGAAPVTGEFEYSRHNGVLSPVVERRGDDAYVVSSAYFDQVGMGNAELYQMAHARTHADIKAALAPMDLYPANLILAGRDGTLQTSGPAVFRSVPTGWT